MKFKIGQTIRIGDDTGLSPPGVIVSRNFYTKEYEVCVQGRPKHEFVDEYFLVYLTPEESVIHDILEE